MKGWITIKSFKHKRLHLKGEIVNEKEIDPIWYDQLEKQGLIRWIEKPVIIMPKIIIPKAEKKPVIIIKKPKPKKNVRKS